MLYKALDPTHNGDGPRFIQSKTGHLIDYRNALMNRNNAILAEQPMTPFGRVVDPIKAGVRALMPGKATGAGIAFAEGSEGRSMPMIERAFKSVANDPMYDLPLPDQPLYPRGTQQGAPLALPSPSPKMGPITPDASGVRSVPAMAHPPNPRLALPQGGNGPFTVGSPGMAPSQMPPLRGGRGVLVPDVSSVSGRDAMVQPPNPGRALPPAPNVRTTAPPPVSPDGSYVTSTQGMAYPPDTTRALPASSTRVTPTPPDASFVRGQPQLTNPATGQPWTAAELKSLQASYPPKYARGGIIRQPTVATIGEDGPEAVVPIGPPRFRSPASQLKHEANSEKYKIMNQAEKQSAPPRYRRK